MRCQLSWKSKPRVLLARLPAFKGATRIYSSETAPRSGFYSISVQARIVRSEINTKDRDNTDKCDKLDNNTKKKNLISELCPDTTL